MGLGLSLIVEHLRSHCIASYLSYRVLFYIQDSTFAYTTYGLTTLVSCGLCVILPETLNKPLPDSIQDVEMDTGGDELRDKKKF